ncbi:MAG: glycosyltransferase family 4 protein [Planctomycetota bacterium]|jgi:glycosyltransferase involved in cell wall biosynthesis
MTAPGNGSARRGPITPILVASVLEPSAEAFLALNLATAFHSAQMPHHLVAIGGPLAPAFEQRGLAFTEARPLKWPVVGRVLAKRLRRKFRPDGGEWQPVVHALSSEAIVPARRLATALKAPLCVSVHTLADPRPLGRLSQVGAVSVFGDALRQDCVNRRGAARKQVRVIPAGLELGPDPAPPLAHGGAPVVGTVFELGGRESLPLFLAAGQTIVAAAPEAELLVVGVSKRLRRGPDLDKLRDAIHARGLAKRVTLTDPMDPRRALPVMDVCVLPYRDDGPGSLLLEALASARPVVAVGSGDVYAAIQDGETGVLVQKSASPEDVGVALGEAVAGLIADPARARALGEKARAHVTERFPQEPMLKEVMAMYRSLIQ